MKKILLILIVWLIAIPCSAHKEWVHQYIVQEAYRYLAKQVGEISTLRYYSGIDFNGTNIPHFGPGNSPHPWDLPVGISVGVWREDVLDPVWRNYGFLSDYLVSINHFWSADDGDDTETNFHGLLRDEPNAWDKTRRYLRLNNVHNNENLYIDGQYSVVSKVGKKNCHAISMSYNNLCDLVVNGNNHVNYAHYYEVGSYNEKSVEISNGADMLGPTRAKFIGYCILGHILHLLADMSAPAHTHGDSHGCSAPVWDGDTYELAMGSNLDGGCNDVHTSFLAQNWTATTAAKQGGLLLEVFSMSDEDATRYMFYTMNQLASHFGSNNDVGNDNLPNGNSMLVSARYPLLGYVGTSSVGWTNKTQSIIDFTGDELMNYAIRVSATFMYWFAVKSGIVSCPATLYQQSHTYYGVRTASENATFKASSKIIAGRNVNPNLTSSQGNVVVESGTLTYLAGDEIQLKDGFMAKAGCNFHAKIQNACPLATNCSTITSSINDEKPTLTMPHQTENDATFAKKGDTPSILAVGDTIQKCIIFIPKEASVTTSGDTIILSNWLETIDIRKPNDTLPGDTTIADGPIWTYTDSLQIRRAVDSVLTDTLVLSYDYFCTVLMEYSTSRVIIIKSDTSGTARNNGDDYTPRIHNIYPNPNSDYIDMQIDGRGSSSTVTIYTQMGVKISETTVSSSEKLSRVSTSGLAPGMYMAVVKTAKGKTSKNFVVHR